MARWVWTGTMARRGLDSRGVFFGADGDPVPLWGNLGLRQSILVKLFFSPAGTRRTTYPRWRPAPESRLRIDKPGR